MRISRPRITILLCSMLALCLLVLCSCAHQTDEEVIEESISKRLDGYMSPDSAETANFAARMDVDSLSQYGVSMSDFMGEYLEGFEYTIESVEVDGDTAKATIAMKCKSFSEYEATLEEAATSLREDSEIANMSINELDRAFGKAVLDSLENVPVRDTEPVIITFEKTNNVWVPVSNASDDIASALISN